MVTSNEGNDQLPLVKDGPPANPAGWNALIAGLARREWDCT